MIIFLIGMCGSCVFIHDDDTYDMRFKDFVYNEADPGMPLPDPGMPPGPSPLGGADAGLGAPDAMGAPGMDMGGMPGGAPGMDMGGMPGGMGGAPGMDAGMGGMPGGNMQQVPVVMKDPDVWSVMKKILKNKSPKSKSSKNPGAKSDQSSDESGHLLRYKRPDSISGSDSQGF